MKAYLRSGVWVVLVLLGTVLSHRSGQMLRSLRSSLEWARDASSGTEGGGSSPSGTTSRPELATAALLSGAGGVLRPLAVNFLMLRSVTLVRAGRFFESAALAQAVSLLQPRRAQVWAFQAWNLMYNITARLPADERFPWVLEGLRLLLDGGLRYNPRSPELCRELAMAFLDKIGREPDDLGVDEAVRAYQDGLARRFEGSSAAARIGTDAQRKLLAQWKLDPSRLEQLASRYLGVGTELDLRSPFSHGLYWSELGLECARENRPRLTGWLEDYRLFALIELLGRGRVLRQPGGNHYAFLPERRVAESTWSVFKASTEAGQEERRAFWSQAAAAIFLGGDPNGARTWCRRFLDVEGEDFVSLLLAQLQVIGELATEARARRAVVTSLRSALLTRLAGAADIADAFVELAGILDLRARRQGVVLPPLAAWRLALQISLRSDLKRLDEDLRRELLSRLPRIEDVETAMPVELPSCPRLFFGIEALDPLAKETRT